MKKMMLVVLLTFFSSQTYAAELKTMEDVRKLTDLTVERLAANDFAGGFGGLQENWPLPDSEVKSVIYQAQSQMTIIGSRFGRSTGSEHIKTEYVGDSFAKLTYVQKFENHALRWVFVFYKPMNRWLVNSVYFDDKIELLFTE